MIGAARSRRLFDQRDRRVRTLPFLLVLGLAFALYPLEPDVASPLETWAAVALAAATVTAIALVPWRRLPRSAALVPMLSFLATVALLRETHGGGQSGYAPLVLVPVLWAGAFGRWRDLAATCVCAGLTLGLPVALVGAPHYPLPEARRALLTTLVGAAAGAGIALLVRALTKELTRRERAERRLERLTAAEIHDDVVQALTVVQLALALGDRDSADTALTSAIRSAEDVTRTMLAASGATYRAGEQRRRNGAHVPRP